MRQKWFDAEKNQLLNKKSQNVLKMTQYIKNESLIKEDEKDNVPE